MKVDALFISDVHLGSRGCNAMRLLSILKKYEPQNLFIVGDFIDGWMLKKRHYWKQEYTNVIRKILSYSKNGTNVFYITGNHDDFLREYSPITFGNIQIIDEIEWNGYYITHGDLYDGVVQLKWLGMLGAIGYELSIFIDRFFKRLGFKYSLSKFLKNKVKDAVKFITKFENHLAFQAFHRNAKGVVCGHIHTPINKIIYVNESPIEYWNCGDFIENYSYIVFKNGKMKLHHS